MGASPAVKSADRVLTILEYLADHRGATFAAIVRDLGLPNSSTHQLLRTIRQRGFVEFDEITREFKLGFRLWEVAQSYSSVQHLADIAQPFMDELTAVTKETVQLSRLDGLENVYLAISESPHPMKLVSSVGHRLPAHTTGLGKVLLAELPDAVLDERLDGATLQRFTENTITDPAQLRAELKRIREQGYGEDREEYVVGCRCIAMPIHDPSGTTIAAMSVSVPTPRFDQQLARQIHAALPDTIRQLEAKLGAGD
ncbi:IclR family transcriptional regulator [Jiangella rhizosphaerae]|uniref:IclR family transcriptional regulator n=1 Tax=Jiangella rhizosphaerae TaxID=2293569 RepID=A0A418KU36_9ACTN|nr:IclR family transcriptional regulator [Jiangella rhizosphaerae]RIQ30983.1 IclR family transcriptional regulator [Jiangella rhizosphaerae]